MCKPAEHKSPAAVVLVLGQQVWALFRQDLVVQPPFPTHCEEDPVWMVPNSTGQVRSCFSHEMFLKLDRPLSTVCVLLQCVPVDSAKDMLGRPGTLGFPVTAL